LAIGPGFYAEYVAPLFALPPIADITVQGAQNSFARAGNFVWSMLSIFARACGRSRTRRIKSAFYDEVSTSFIAIFYVLFCFPQRCQQPCDFGIALRNHPPKFVLFGVVCSFGHLLSLAF
jgi:hypothetical protein